MKALCGWAAGALACTTVTAALAAPALSPMDAEVAADTAIIGKEDMPWDGEPRCLVTFSYAGYVPETLFWDGEPCSDVSVSFLGRERLIELGDWEVLDDYARERILQGPDGRVLYVEGTFTASVFPIDYNQLTYEVTVSD